MATVLLGGAADTFLRPYCWLLVGLSPFFSANLGMRFACAQQIPEVAVIADTVVEECP
jgi:hypothetical protein